MISDTSKNPGKDKSNTKIPSMTGFQKNSFFLSKPPKPLDKIDRLVHKKVTEVLDSNIQETSSPKSRHGVSADHEHNHPSHPNHDEQVRFQDSKKKNLSQHPKNKNNPSLAYYRQTSAPQIQQSPNYKSQNLHGLNKYSDGSSRFKSMRRPGVPNGNYNQTSQKDRVNHHKEAESLKYRKVEREEPEPEPEPIGKIERIPMRVKVRCPAFYTANQINPKTSLNTFGKKDRKELIQTKTLHNLEPIESGNNVIVIHPGSNTLRVGFASDPVPKSIPHVIARRIRKSILDLEPNENSVDTYESRKQETADKSIINQKVDQETKVLDIQSSKDTNANENSRETGVSSKISRSISQQDAEDEELVCRIIDSLYEDLKARQRETKRKPVPNSLSQIISYNKSSKPEIIQDHNDPYKVDWIDPEANTDKQPCEVYYGEEALKLINCDKYMIRRPLVRGSFNTEDYTTIEDVLGDMTDLWTYALEETLGVSQKELKNYYVVLAIPDIFTKSHVESMIRLLLEYMGFGAIIVHQSSVLVTLGAGISNACVIDVGAQKTSISCVEDGYCLPDTRLNIKYGGDDISKFLADLLVRDLFPYHELDLNRHYDMNLINDIKEKHVTLNLSDVNIRVYDFFVRAPFRATEKYSFKVYDEMYLAPWCLFYPELVTVYSKFPDWKNSYINLLSSTLGDETSEHSNENITMTQFGKLPSTDEVIIIELPAKDGDDSAKNHDTQNTIDGASSLLKTQLAQEKEKTKLISGDASTPLPSLMATPLSKSTNASIPGTPILQREEKIIVEVLPESQSEGPKIQKIINRVYHESDVDKLMPLDKAIVHSIAHSGGMDKVKKFYTSIVLVGGGISFISGINELLKERLARCSKEIYAENETVDRIDTFPSPRDLDPRLLVWKGGAVLSRLDVAKETWISEAEWRQMGSRLLRERSLFSW
ncbi:hypothetical protein BB560_000950 [Smittium megazygosporum]|uniref:Uncharacterized protein n=1 Tax=Smittium megazygosporum TaxID=133381 RepID=A0A2T9ZIV6_9FUNG|nr:hypothetical protein BB560_000950 [Smittium megazygosporum]